MIKIQSRRLLLAVLLGIAIPAMSQTRRTEENMVRNPDFKVPGGKGVPAEWSRWGPLLDSDRKSVV